MIRKKALLISSGITSLILFFLNGIGTYTLCGEQRNQCISLVSDTMINLFPVIPFFLLSLITYKMRDEIYRAWLKFSYVWIPLSMVCIFIAPQYTTGWMFPVVKGTVAFFSSIFYLIISLLIILWMKLAPSKNAS